MKNERWEYQVKMQSPQWGHSITTWTRWGGRDQKMSVFVHAQGIKTVHAGGGGGQKNAKIMST